MSLFAQNLAYLEYNRHLMFRNKYLIKVVAANTEKNIF